MACLNIFHVLMALTFTHCRYKSSVPKLITQRRPKYGPHSPKLFILRVIKYSSYRKQNHTKSYSINDFPITSPVFDVIYHF